MLRKIRKLWEFVGFISFWILIQTGVLFSANPGDIVITEFFYKSAGNIYEYIELYNTTDSTIDLHLWEIEIDGVEFPIDDPLNIDSLDYVVLVSFSGIFQDNVGSGTTYCPSNIASAFDNNCDNIQATLSYDGIYLGSGYADNGAIVIVLNNDIEKLNELFNILK